MSRKKLHIAGYVLFLLLPTVLMAGPLVRGCIPDFMDNVMYFFPLRVHAARLFHSGEFPFWNRCLMGGMPLYENPQAAIAYPLHWPFFVWPNGFWFLWPMLLQLGAYAALTVWALRQMGAGKRAAWFGGALALAGSYGWSRLQYGNYMNVLPWWPLWLGAAHMFVRRFRGLSLGIVALALTIYAGAHQLAAYGIALLVVYALLQAALGRQWGLGWAGWLGFMIYTVTFMVLISAPAWYPQNVFIKLTSRTGGLDIDAVLAGTISGFGELMKALIGDWGLLSSGGWADAEIANAIGPLAFVLALCMPRRGHLRRAWIACWAAIAVGILFSLRIVMEPLLRVIPVAGIFHDPRRWLGAAQWFLILAAALGSTSLHKIRIPVARNAFLAFAVIIPAWFTWKTVDMAMRPAGELTSSKALIMEARLQPGERFFTIDYKRDASYDYRRPELLNWALPNLSMLWGIEDLGGYEPAQSAAYATFMSRLHGNEPWRQIWVNHFGLVRNAAARRFFDEGNVRAAIMPRWGVPMFFRPVDEGVGVAAGAWREENIRALISGPIRAPARLFAISGQEQRLVAEADTHPVSASDDQVITSATMARSPSPLNENIGIVDFKRGNEAADALAIQVAPASKLIDAYAWGIAEAALWQPVQMGEVATLMRHQGNPSYIEWNTGIGKILKQQIRANSIELDVESTSGTVVIHDAYWPGWKARVDGKPAKIMRAGLWRAIQVPAGTRRIEMVYRPISLGMATFCFLIGTFFFAIVAFVDSGLFYKLIIRPRIKKYLSEQHPEIGDT